MKIRKLDWNLASDREAFVSLPWRLYPAEAWVPPLKAVLAAELSPDNPFFQHGKARIWLAERDGEPVGRIVASIDEHLLRREIGHMGYFECTQDAEVAASLFHAAEAWLSAQGRTLVHGPVNLSVYQGYRLQIAGFETRPFLGEPRALPHYPGLLEQAGYQPAARWFSWDIPAPALLGLRDYMAAKAVSLPPGCSLRSFEGADEASFLADLHRIAMRTFAENYGFAELDLAQFLHLHDGLLLIFRRHPELLVICYSGDEPMGLGFIYPDYASFLQAARGESEALAGFGAAQAHDMIYHTFGVVPEWRHSALPYALFAYGIEQVARLGSETVIGALAKEGRTAYDQLGTPTRTYAVYEKRLA